MYRHPLGSAASDGTHARRPGRTLLLGATLTGLAGAFLLSQGSPFMQPAPTVSMAPPSHARMPLTPVREPEPVRFDRLARRARLESDRASRTAPATDATRRVRRTQISVQPAADQAEFVPTPPTRVAVPSQPANAPAQPARDDPQWPDPPRTAEKMIATVQYHKLDEALLQVIKEDPTTPVRVILRAEPGADQTMADWLAAEGRQIHQRHPFIGGLTATLSASDVAMLTTDPSIRRMSIDAVVHATADPVSGDVFRDALGLEKSGGEKASPWR